LFAWKEIYFMERHNMRRLALSAGLAILLAVPASLAAQAAPQVTSEGTYNHGEVSAYGDLFRIAPPGVSATNFVGLGGRAGFNAGEHVAIEGELNYDFERNYTSVVTNNSSGVITSSTYTAKVRPITGLFGPKFQFGTSGPFRAFVDAKLGFLDFSTSCNAPAGSPSCFSTSLSSFGGSSTHFDFFPGGGIEGFWGPFGLRVDAGDEIYWNNGANNNLRVAFGPTFRF
jgi:hypothetical protein